MTLGPKAREKEPCKERGLKGLNNNVKVLIQETICHTPKTETAEHKGFHLDVEKSQGLTSWVGGREQDEMCVSAGMLLEPPREGGCWLELSR